MKIVQPYKHDCDRCKWVDWITVGDTLGNMYICQSGKMGERTEIIIRWSDDPPDYSCYSYDPDLDKKSDPITIMGD